MAKSAMSKSVVPTSSLIVRDVKKEIISKLKTRAAKNGRSAEAEHREILAAVLLGGPKKKTFAQVLAEMPNVGNDVDFERIDDDKRDDVFN